MNRKNLLSVGIILGIFCVLLIGFFVWRAHYRFGSSSATPSPGNEFPSEQIILIQNYAFNPARVVIKKGEQVTWSNLDPVPHTVTATILGGQHVVKPGTTLTLATDAILLTGEITYQSDFDPGMTGTLAIVTDKTPSAFQNFYNGLKQQQKDCIAQTFGSRLQGFLDGSLLTPTRDETVALTQCTQ